MKSALLVVVAVALTLKTSVSTTACRSCSIAASDYDRSCTQDSECTGIDEGDICSPECPGCVVNAAINVRNQARYLDDLRSESGARVPCSCPQTPVVACKAGICGTTTFFPMLPEGTVGKEDAAPDGPGVDAAGDSGTDALAADTGGPDAADAADAVGE